MTTDGYRRLGKDRLGKVRDNNILPEHCSEQSAAEETIDPVILLKDGTEYTISEKDIAEYARLYPEIDVNAEIRKMIGWNINNPQRRKTRRGIRKFVNGWMARAYDAVLKSESEKKATMAEKHGFTERNYDFDSIEQQLLRKQFEE